MINLIGHKPTVKELFLGKLRLPRGWIKTNYGYKQLLSNGGWIEHYYINGKYDGAVTVDWTGAPIHPED